MATELFFRSVPYDKAAVTLALEAGAANLAVAADKVETAAALARCRVLADEEILSLRLGQGSGAEAENQAAAALAAGQTVLLQAGWEVIPVENLLARSARNPQPGLLILEISGPGAPAQARLAAGIMQCGVAAVLLQAEDLKQCGPVAKALQGGPEQLELDEAEIIAITPVGLGHRVCVDTLSKLQTGQGMLVGDSSAFTFLVNAETEPNEYVASRPFRVNAGAVHSYALMPGDRTAYLADLQSGQEILTVRHNGQCGRAVIGRLKVEQRPMLQVRARCHGREGSLFLQNAETIRLVRPGGAVVSVVALQPGDLVLCRLDAAGEGQGAGRHFGLRIKEDITE